MNFSYKYKKGLVYNICLVTLLSVSMSWSSCRKTVDAERITSYVGSYSDVFESFWHGINENYAFWGIETVNWDNMYTTYKPRFEYLDKIKATDPTTVNMAAQYLVDMTKDLKDSHFALTFNGNVDFLIESYPVHSNSFSPAGIRHELRGDRAPIPRAVFDTLIPKYYLTKAEFGTDGNSFEMNMGIIPYNGKKILYLEFSGFALESNYYGANATANPVKPVLDDFFRYTKDPSVDGLILDLRGNPGGSVPDLDFLIGRLITKPMQNSNTRIKEGSGRLDYAPWVKGYVHPQPGSIDFNKPFAVLTDGNSVSMSEMTTLTVKELFPKAKQVGEQTWGGTGQIPSTDVKYLGGQFIAAGFVQVYMAGVEFRDKNLVSYENKGITPDIPITYDTTAIKRNIDVQLNRGLQYVTTLN